MEQPPRRDVVPAESLKGPEDVRTFKMRLHIFRHAEKASPNAVAQDADQVVPLTPRGREQSIERGQALDLKDAIASGSPRVRGQETALFAAMHAEASPDASFDELLQISNNTASWVNNRLDMPFVKGTPYHEALNKAYEEGVYFETLAKLDQDIADKGESTYAVQARNIAEIVDRFARIAGKLAERAAYEEKDDGSREQVMGTHGSVSESFLAEILKRADGEEERQRFIHTFPNGFTFTEGFDAFIAATSDGQEPTLRIRFTAGKEENEYRFDREIPLSYVRDIINSFAPKDS